MPIEPLNIASYSTFTKSNPIVLVHFWAGWNANDYQMKKTLEQLAESYKDRVNFGRVDVDLPEMSGLCVELKILNVPGLVYYRNGNHIETTLGLKSEKQVEESLQSIIRSNVERKNSG